MLISSATTALLIAAAPVSPDGVPPEAPVIPSASESNAPQDTAPVAPAGAGDRPPSLPEMPGESAPAPAATPAAPGSEQAQGQSQDTIVVVGKPSAPTPGDPLEKLNVQTYEIARDVDKAVVRPISRVYADLPKPLRKGLHNILLNLDQPVIVINFLLQLKPGKAMEALARFAINTTIGVGGLFDVAKKRPFNLPYRPNGFADTMGYYGIGPGAYMYLPLVGPTTVRDLLGLWMDRAFLPALGRKPFNKPAFAVSVAVVRALDYRVEFDETLQALNYEAEDPYAARRNYYLQQRQAEIDALRGRPVVQPVLPPPADSETGAVVPHEGDPAAATPAATPAAPVHAGPGTTPEPSPQEPVAQPAN